MKTSSDENLYIVFIMEREDLWKPAVPYHCTVPYRTVVPYHTVVPYRTAEPYRTAVQYRIAEPYRKVPLYFVNRKCRSPNEESFLTTFTEYFWIV